MPTGATITAALSLATASAQGAQSATDFKRKNQVYDAVADFGFVGDWKTPVVIGVGYDGAISSGQNTFTAATTQPFAAGDVGKTIVISGAGASGAKFITTITGYTDSGHVTLNANAGTTVTTAAFSFGTDNTTAISNMTTTINGLSYPGVTVKFPISTTNCYGFSTAVTFNKPCIIEGTASAFSEDCGDYAKGGGTRLAWVAPASTTGTTTFGAWWTFSPTLGVNSQALASVGFKNVFIDCRNGDQSQALIGVAMLSCHGFVWENVFVQDALAVSVFLGVVAPGTATPNAGSLGEAKDCTRGTLRDLRIRQLDQTAYPAVTTTPTTTSTAITWTTSGQSITIAAANGLTASGYVWVQSQMGYPVLVNYTGGGGGTLLTGCTVSLQDTINAPASVSGSNVVQATPGNACGVMLTGDAVANSCCALGTSVQISHGATWGPAAMEFVNSDSWNWESIYINGGNATNDGAINRIRKPGIRFNGSNTNQSLCARNNTISGGSTGAGGCSHMALLNTGALLAGVSGPNYTTLQQTGNGEPLPMYEAVTASATQGAASAMQFYNTNGGFQLGIIGKPATATQTITGATTALVAGTMVTVPPQGWQIGTTLRWTAYLSKTAFGTAARTVAIKYGTGGNTSDATTIATLQHTPTAVADAGMLTIELTVTALGSGTSGAATAVCSLVHNLAATGLSTTGASGAGFASMTMAGFDTTISNSNHAFLHLDMTVGASEVITIIQAYVQCIHQ
jgi:hypothetical protein